MTEVKHQLLPSHKAGEPIQPGFVLTAGNRSLAFFPDGAGDIHVFSWFSPAHATADYLGPLAKIDGESIEALWERANPVPPTEAFPLKQR